MQKQLDRFVYLEKDLLGKGSFGRVYRGTDTQTKEKVAIKIMDMTLFNDEFMIESLKNEISVMKELQHPHVVRMIDVFGDNKQTVIVIELCDGGDLRKFLQHHGGNLDENTAQEVMRQLMEGFHEMTRHGYIHRDIKPENALIKDNVHKVADFGFATKADITGRQLLKECVGTPLYMAPQLLERKPYTAKCDIWSIGILAYEMIYGKQPWPCRDVNSYLANISCQPLKFPFDKKISEQFKDFIRKCLSVDEIQRVSWFDVFNHPFLQVNDNSRLYKNEEIDENSRKILAQIQKIVQARGLNVNEQFIKFDTDKGGSLDCFELYQFLLQLDPTITTFESRHLYRLLDQNKDGKITLEEFKHIFCDYDFADIKDVAGRIITDLKEIIKANNLSLKDIFENFDEDKRGDLSFDEFSRLIKVIAPAIKTIEIKQIFEKFDANHDGSISFDEFKKELSYCIDDNFDPKQKKAQKILAELKRLVIVNKINSEQIFKNFDKNANQFLEFEEFQILCGVVDKNMTVEEKHCAFKMLDTHNKDKIDIQQFQSIFN